MISWATFVFMAGRYNNSVITYIPAGYPTIFLCFVFFFFIQSWLYKWGKLCLCSHILCTGRLRRYPYLWHEERRLSMGGDNVITISLNICTLRPCDKRTERYLTAAVLVCVPVFISNTDIILFHYIITFDVSSLRDTST